MRTHSDIIRDAGGPAKFGRAIDVLANNTKAWARLNSIPAPYWAIIDALGLATLKELADAVAKVPPSEPSVPTFDGLTSPDWSVAFDLSRPVDAAIATFWDNGRITGSVVIPSSSHMQNAENTAKDTAFCGAGE